MKLLIGLDYSVIGNVPEKIMESILKFDDIHSIQGFEYGFSVLDEESMKTAINLTKLVKSYDLELQIKGINLDRGILLHEQFLDFYNNISKLLEKRITISYDPCIGEDKQSSIDETKEKMAYLLHYNEQHRYNLQLSIINVEYANRVQLADIPLMTETLPFLYFTYDIAHQGIVTDYDYSIPAELVCKLACVHIHDFQNDIGHYPFKYGSLDLYEVFNYLNKIGYRKEVVLDIKSKYLDGETIQEKMVSYIIEAKKVKFIKERYVKE